jgi:hypothetical protein
MGLTFLKTNGRNTDRKFQFLVAYLRVKRQVLERSSIHPYEEASLVV